jgi:hypothetical protein
MRAELAMARHTLFLLPLILGGCPDPTAGSASESPGPPATGAPSGPAGGPAAAGGAAQPGPGKRPQAPGFKVEAGQGLKISGTIAYAGEKKGTVRMDFLKVGASGDFPELVHTMDLAAVGPWELEVPKDAGELAIVCYMDADDNGPSDGEPAGRVAGRIKVGQDPVTGLDITLADEPDLGDLKPGPPPGGAPPAGGGQMPPNAGAGAAPPGAGGAPPDAATTTPSAEAAPAAGATADAAAGAPAPAAAPQ